MNAWRTGISNAPATPSTSDASTSTHAEMSPWNASTASPPASAICTTWITINTPRRLKRSVSSELNGDSTSDGICPENAINPSMNAEPVTRYAIQPNATCCTHVPMSETHWP